MRSPNLDPPAQEGYVDFHPVFCDTDGTARPTKKGEAWELVRADRYKVWGEPLPWFLVDHVPFRSVLRWYIENFVWDIYSTVAYEWLRPFKVALSRWYVPCEPGEHHLMMEKATDLERAAHLWRTLAFLALILGMSIGVYFAR